MASLEAELLLTGAWKNIDELEENLCLQELDIVLKASRKLENHRRKFAAALKGINLDLEDGPNEGAPTFEEVKRRAEAKLAGKTEEELDFETIGFGYVEE